MTTQASRFSAKFLGNCRLTAWLMFVNGLIWIFILLVTKKPTFFHYFNAIFHPLSVLFFWRLQQRLATGPALWLENGILTYKQGVFTRRIPWSRIARITDDGRRVLLLDGDGQRITAFGQKNYDDLSWLCALKPDQQPTTSTCENDSMKKAFLIALGVSFGVTAAVILSAVVLYSMGSVRRDILGGLVIVLGSSDRSTIEDYEKQTAATKSLVISELKWIRQADALDVIFTVENAKDYALDKTVFFQLVFLRGDELKGVATEMESLVVPANGKTNVVMKVHRDVPTEFDVLRIAQKN